MARAPRANKESAAGTNRYGQPPLKPERIETPESPDRRLGAFYISIDCRPFSAQTLPDSPSHRGRARFGSVVWIARHHFVAARFLPARKFCLSTAAKPPERCALPSCAV